MDRARTQLMAHSMSISELSEVFEELKNKYENLWEQVDTLYRDGATAKHVETIMEKCVEQLNGRIVMSNATTLARIDKMEKYVTQMNDRIDTLNSKTNDIVEDDRDTQRNIRGLRSILDERSSIENEWTDHQITMLQNENRRARTNITWLMYTNGIIFIIMGYIIFTIKENA
jgi:hypothetical protein